MSEYQDPITRYFDILFQLENLQSLEVASKRVSEETGVEYQTVLRELKLYQKTLKKRLKVLETVQHKKLYTGNQYEVVTPAQYPRKRYT